MSNIRSLVENKSKLDYKELTLSLVQEFGIKDKVEWDSVIPAQVQKELFGGETLRLFKDHETFANQKDIRAIHRSKGETSQLLILSAILNDEKLSKQTIERITKKFVGGQAAERYVVWFLGNPQQTVYKVVLSGKEGKKVVLKTLPFAVDQPYYKTYDFILNEVSSKVNKFFVEPNELWKSLWKAFDISVVNKKFYLDIKSAFDSLVNDDLFKGSIRIEEARKQFAVRLIGRIIFSWFLKKKGIISNDVLSSNAVRKYDNYYLELLEKLFFGVFNTPQNERIKIPELVKEYPFLNGGLFEVQIGDYGDYQGKVFIDNDWFFGLFSNTLEKYNFTIDENTSSNSEIAIDPEMLGRIFENLLAEQNPETKESARKSTGSYYTPREIVDYMVEQSLIEYLKSNVIARNEETKQSQKQPESVILSEAKNLHPAIEDFVHTEELPEELKPYSNEILDKLNYVKILDPACGSGAFPIGMLQKLVALKQSILSFRSRLGGREILKPKSEEKEIYSLKLQTILNSIYGCDIQPMAVELSRLRCWLSLIIDEPVDKKKSNWGIEPLPHLDFKFVCGNSLIGLSQYSTGDMFDKNYERKQELKNQLKEIREKYFSVRTKEEKIELQQLDNAAFNDLLTLIRKEPDFATTAKLLLTFKPYEIINQADFFDPDWMFGIKDFDICIGNPPYIRQEALKPIKTLLQSQNYSVYNSTSDIYTYFYERGYQLLKQNGTLCYITSNKWLRAKYGEKLRKLLKERTTIKYLIDFGGYKVFESATVDTNILIFKKQTTQSNSFFAVNVSRELSDNNFIEYLNQNIITIDQSKLNQTSFTLSNNSELNLKTKIEKAGLPLTKHGASIYRGIITGFNKAFIIDTETRNQLVNDDPNVQEFIKPILRGRDISRYHYNWAGLWLIKIESGFTNANKKKDESAEEFFKRKFPSLHKYFNNLLAQIEKGEINFKGKGLLNRDDQGDYWWELRDCDYYDEFENAKIFVSEFGYEFCGAFDTTQKYGLDTTHIIRGNKYHLAVLNSKVIHKYFTFIATGLGDKGIRFKPQFIDKLPIPILSEARQKPFIELVDQILLSKQQNPQAATKHLEDKIDLMVYKLYNLTYEEIKIIDPEIEKIISKEEYERFGIK